MLGLEFLHAHHVGVLAGQPVEKAFCVAERMPLRLALMIRGKRSLHAMLSPVFAGASVAKY